MTAYYSIDMTHGDSINWFLADYYRHRIPAAPPGHLRNAISIKLNTDVEDYVPATVRYHGVYQSRFGRVFVFFLPANGTTVDRMIYCLDGPERADLPGAVRILDYTILAVDTTNPGNVGGSVTSATEADGVVGATVKISKDGYSKTTTTIAAGVYAMTGIPVNIGYTLTVTAVGYAAKTESGINITENETTTKNITLTECGKLNGKVTDDKGSLEGAAVNVVAVGTEGPVLYTGDSDANGDYECKNVDPGTYDVLFSAQNHVTGKSESVVVATNAIKTENKQIGRYPTYGGTVSGSGGGNMVATVEFFAIYPGAPAYCDETDGTGVYEIENIEPGTYQVRVTAADHSPGYVMDRIVVADTDALHDDWTLTAT